MICDHIYIDARNFGMHFGFLKLSLKDAAVEIVKECPNQSFIYDANYESLYDVNRDYYNINELASLAHTNIQFLKPHRLKMIKALEQDINSYRDVPWSLIIPKDELKESFKDVASMSQTLLNSDVTGYYVDVYSMHRDVFLSLHDAFVDKHKILFHASNEENQTCLSALESCMPNSKGICNSIIYDIAGSVTGRMRILSGPNVLALKKQYRDIFVSKYKNGSIISIDMSSFEPRVALALANQTEMASQIDIYEKLASMLLVPRGVAKHAIIAMMFGASNHTLANILGTTERGLLSELAELLEINKISKELSQQLSGLGYIKNHYGRPVFPSSNDDNVLYNNFVQSTAVDVSLIAFRSIINTLNNNDIKMCPIFLVHDCIYLDIHPDSIQYILNMVHQPMHIDGMQDIQFYMKCEIINGNK